MVEQGAVVSTSEETVAVVFAVLFAAVSFARTANFRRRLGRNPWGIHPNLWLVIGFALGPIGACLAFLACATTRVGPAFGPGPSAGTSLGVTARPSPVTGPPPGWYPDPSGRHEYRFFTGHDWTADVVDNGTHMTEPLPAPPAS
jgi:hypothetical protein